MSEAAWQSAFSLLVTDVGFRDDVRRRGRSALDACALGLSGAEMERLLAIADAPGLDVMRKLHKGFRMNKLLSMLPLSCRLLGVSRLAREAGDFWSHHHPTSFYYAEEAEAFAAHLEARRKAGLRVPYLGEILAYERAAIALCKPRINQGQPPTVSVTFRHDPVHLLGTLSKGERPRRVPRRHRRLVGKLDEDGEPDWSLVPA